MVESIRHDYEVSSEGAVRHWEFPWARLEDATPTATLPARVTSLLPGTMLTGTILTVDAVTNTAVIDVTCGMVYWHEVRNVLTYNPAEATWGPINIGDIIYYDGSGIMPAGVYLSLSPLDSGGLANTIFGWAVPANDTDMALFAKGVALVASTQEVAVMQVGAGR
jgi:hypothetical protein